MSQQPNEDVPKQSHPQQTGSKDVAMPRPFSIRKYVLAYRKINIRKNWPFEEKYLDYCLKLGMKEVLPPMHIPKSAMLSQNDDDNNENNCDNKVTSNSSSNEEGNQDDSITFSNFFSPSKAVDKNKRRRRKPEVTKRFIADVSSVAQCSTQEEIQSMNQYTSADLPADEESCTGAASENDDDDVV